MAIEQLVKRPLVKAQRASNGNCKCHTVDPISLKSDKLAANELGSRNMNWYLVGKSRPIGCREADDGLAGKQGRHHDMSGILYSKSNRPACEGPVFNRVAVPQTALSHRFHLPRSRLRRKAASSFTTLYRTMLGRRGPSGLPRR